MKSKIDQYIELLRKWNGAVNLVSKGELDIFRERHVADVYELSKVMATDGRVIDLGTGAGIPGLILKMIRPKMDVTLVDSKRKKAAFCEEVIRVLGLHGVSVICGRAENLERHDIINICDYIVSRATWRLGVFLDIAAKYIGAGGKCIAMKGPRWQEELKEAQLIDIYKDYILKEAREYKLSDGIKRCIIVHERKL